MPTYQDYTFPSDLENSKAYPDMIQIRILKQGGADLKKFTSGLDNSITEQLKSKGIREKIFAGLDEKKDAGKIESLQKALDSGNATLIIAKISAQQAINGLKNEGTLDALDLVGSIIGTAASTAAADFQKSKPTLEMLNLISLPMPDNLTYNEQIEWQSTDLGGIGGLAQGAKLGGGSAAGAGFSQLGSIISGGTGALVSSVLGAGIAGGAVLGVLGAGNAVQGTIESQIKIKSNPFKEQTFQGVPFRPFEFSWTFSPTSQTEVDTIKEIINLLRQNSRPDYNGGNEFLFTYPNTMQIEFKTYLRKNDITVEDDVLINNDYLPKLHPCVCKSINTNYATAGWHSFVDGAPTSITLQLQFEEINIVTSEQIKTEGY